jgi:hypothetical protein
MYLDKSVSQWWMTQQNVDVIAYFGEMIAQLVDDLHESLKPCEKRFKSRRQCVGDIGSPGSKCYRLIGSTDDRNRAIQAIQALICVINQVAQPWWSR